MRKNILLAVIFIVGSVSSAFAAVPIPQIEQVPAYSSYNPATGEEMSGAVKRLSGTVKGVRNNVAAVKKDIKVIKTDISDIRGAVTSIAKSDEVIAKGVAKTNELIQSESVQATKNTRLLGILILVVAILVLVIGRIIVRRSQKAAVEQMQLPAMENSNRSVARADQLNNKVGEVGETVNNRADQLLTELQNGFAEMRTSFIELPTKVVTAIQTLDASPFEFEAAGHQVTYQSPTEGIAEGYYLILHVPKDEVGDAATYDRAHDANRGTARQNCRRTMKKYFEKAFDAPEYALQKALIEYLIKTGAITFRKIV
jgi:hypothetical protein